MNCKMCSAQSRPLYQELFDDRYGYPGTFTIYQCTSCSFAQSVPELSADELNQLYTKYYPRKNITAAGVQQASTFRPGWIFKFKSWLQGTRNICHYHIQPGTRVLDVGCGDGASLLDIQKQGAKAYGTEYDRNVESVAQELGLQIFFGDVANTTYEDDWFDSITMSQLLEHIPDPIAFMLKAKQKLKPGGQIILSFPNIMSFNRKRSGRKWINWHVPYHMNFFTRQSIAHLAEASGLKLSTVRTYTPNLWLLLQHQANRATTVAGQASSAWVTPTAPRSWPAKFSLGIGLLYSLLRIPVTRLQDAQGNGDSFLVILTKPAA